jgi:hypothetical protein
VQLARGEGHGVEVGAAELEPHARRARRHAHRDRAAIGLGILRLPRALLGLLAGPLLSLVLRRARLFLALVDDVEPDRAGDHDDHRDHAERAALEPGRRQVVDP